METQYANGMATRSESTTQGVTTNARLDDSLFASGRFSFTGPLLLRIYNLGQKAAETRSAAFICGIRRALTAKARLNQHSLPNTHPILFWRGAT
jgi:hypothetical protein